MAFFVPSGKPTKKAGNSRRSGKSRLRLSRNKISSSANATHGRAAPSGGGSDSDSSGAKGLQPSHATAVTIVISSSSSESSSDNDTKTTVKVKKEKVQQMLPVPVAPRGYRIVIKEGVHNSCTDSEDVLISSESEYSDLEKITSDDEVTEDEDSSAHASAAATTADQGPRRAMSSGAKHIRDVAASIAGAVDLEKQEASSDDSTGDSADDEYEPSESDISSVYDPSEDEISEEEESSSDGIYIDFDNERRHGPVPPCGGILSRIDIPKFRASPRSSSASGSSAKSGCGGGAAAPTELPVAAQRTRPTGKEASNRRASAAPAAEHSSLSAVRKAEADLQRLERAVDARTRGVDHNSSDDFMSTPPSAAKTKKVCMHVFISCCMDS